MGSSIKCPRCGKEVNSEESFLSCPDCGSMLGGASQQETMKAVGEAEGPAKPAESPAKPAKKG